MNKKINIRIDTNSLIESAQNCNLGMGTYKNPIIADYYATNLSKDNASINLEALGVDKMDLNFTISNNGSGQKPKILDTFFNTVGNNDVVLPNCKIANLYDQVFDCSKSNMKVEGRNLCVTPENGDCDLTVTNATNSSNTPDAYTDSYFTYSVLFELSVNGTPYCFSIDPLIGVRSRRPPA